ncbi:pilus assembly protein TadG-related protein [Desulfovirgula thermocuniculi]|uniref:pilus assembly protein TadG-related protein n=1 Tax=Desulfovirgula thermocuniculi TaxID=348842 RepID=UPI0004187267|nr:pilus assembly protein TadG-related protein [Desulfovirgula thermocuniculi]
MGELVRRFSCGERGTAVLIMMLVVLSCVFGVLGYDYSRAHAVRARLQTAADAAALAGAMQAEVVPEYKYVLVDGSGNETTDPEKAVKVKAKIVKYHCDLQRREAQARQAALAAFRQNLLGEKVPVYDVACPPAAGLVPNPTPGYELQLGVDWSKPKYGSDGSVYYDEFKVSRAEAGVRSYLLVPLFRRVAGGEDAFKELVSAPRPSGWSGAVRLGARGSAQALPPPPPGG